MAANHGAATAKASAAGPGHSRHRRRASHNTGAISTSGTRPLASVATPSAAAAPYSARRSPVSSQSQASSTAVWKNTASGRSVTATKL